MPPSSEIRLTAHLSSTTQPEYSQEERTQLLRLAHEAIVAAVEQGALPDRSYSEHLSQARGAFTTLYLHGKLRGCVGYPLPVAPLFRTIAETARAAAFEDPRFAPVSREESRELKISLSVLSEMKVIRADEIEAGHHGLLISHAGRRGLLLPQVAAEHGWDRVTFLEQTCLKAGLPLNAWQEARIEAFTAEVFGDDICE